MKFLVLLLFLVSCNENPNKPSVREASGLYKYIDNDNNVTCYRVTGYEGLSCLKD